MWGGARGVTCMSTPCSCDCWVRTVVTASNKELQTRVHAGDGRGIWARPLLLEEEEVGGGDLVVPNPTPDPNPTPNPSPTPAVTVAATVSYFMVPAFG